ncbi:MAG: glutamine-hydrolyzing GMP synthase [Anaerolineae bacterium]|nr:MAG: glutamine-hydrolyzing GMP synthase [Anaerolineae bacterium]
MPDTLLVLDFGSQYAQLIARRLREQNIFCRLLPWDAPLREHITPQVKGFVLSGGPASVYASEAPKIPAAVFESGLPILGICYGMQALTHALGGRVAPAERREYGPAHIRVTASNPLLPVGEQLVWMSHGDRIEALPPGFEALASTENAPFAAMGDPKRHYYGVQFHPEVHHTPQGSEILRRFAVDICGARPEWTPQSIIHQTIETLRRQIGDQNVLAAISGGVDSSVAAALVHRAVGNQLKAIFVDTGLLRQGEPELVVRTFRQHLGVQLTAVNAVEDFLQALKGLTDPEAKRRAIGEKFIRIFEEYAQSLGNPPFLVQGTIYPDVIESRAPDKAHAHRIKSHHNVGGLPENFDFQLVEPLRELFKDEVRAVGEALGLPAHIVWRQPFPGPGLAVRCLGEVTWERLERLRQADAIFLQELEAAGLLPHRQQASGGVSQAFAVLLPVRSVGVMGDQRTYQETIVLRAVTTEDFMTADWARLPHDILGRVANRIVNEVAGVNRVVYDITSKPPATIEWE